MEGCGHAFEDAFGGSVFVDFQIELALGESLHLDLISCALGVKLNISLCLSLGLHFEIGPVFHFLLEEFNSFWIAYCDAYGA